MDQNKLQHFKNLLLEEQKQLEENLAGVARKNPSNPADWEPVPDKMQTMRADKNEVADTHEEFETNTAVVLELETRLSNVKNALARIEDGTYGFCVIDGEQHPIPEDRLEANPAADTCLEHTK